MKKVTLALAVALIASMLPRIGFTQKAEWVEQVIVANGNRYEATPPFVDFVTVQTYDPSTGATYLFDEIQTQSVQDVVIANNKIYVAAQDSLAMYDVNTLERIAIIVDSGLSRLYVYNNRLIVTKQFPIKRFFVEVLSADDLSLIARVQNISGECKGVAATSDSIFVAVNGGYLSTEGKLAIINPTNWTLSREINFGTDAVGINDMYNYGGVIFSINETPSGNPDVGSVTAYYPASSSFINYIFDLRVGNSGSGIKNSGTINNMLYLSLDRGIGSFDLSTRQIVDTTILPDPGFANHIYFSSYTTDYVNNYLYVNKGNGISWGYDLVATITGDSVTSFVTELNAEAIALDYRAPVGTNELSSTEGAIALFPNPVDNYLRVRYTGDDSVTEILVRDLTGRTVFHSGEKRSSGTWVDCSSYPPGLYFITVKTDSGTRSAKFIKR